MRRYAMAVAALLAVAACGPDRPAVPTLPNGAIEPGGTYSLVALVAAQAGSQPITWAVEAGGGTVDQHGNYTAPTCAQIIAALPSGTNLATSGQITGTEHVTATWASGSQSITITVSEAVLSVSVTPGSVSVEPNGTVQFHATVHYTCHDQT